MMDKNFFKRFKANYNSYLNNLKANFFRKVKCNFFALKAFTQKVSSSKKIRKLL